MPIRVELKHKKPSPLQVHRLDSLIKKNATFQKALSNIASYP